MQVERACCCFGKQQNIPELGKQFGSGMVMSVVAPDLVSSVKLTWPE